MLPIKWTVLIGSTLKLPTVDWEPTQRAGIQLVTLIITICYNCNYKLNITLQPHFSNLNILRRASHIVHVFNGKDIWGSHRVRAIMRVSPGGSLASSSLSNS